MAKMPYVSRINDSFLADRLRDFAAVMLVGPRACGKTTTAGRLARTTFRLDRPSDASAISIDPDTVLASAEAPVLIDEWQLVPSVLGAVKRAVDEDQTPGRFILAGSARADALASGWPATGRLVRVSQWGLCQRELHGVSGASSFFDAAFSGELASWTAPAQALDLRDYLELALVGGFPEAVLHDSSSRRARWLRSYVDQLLTSDAPLLGEHRDPSRLRRYLRAVAAHTAGVVEHKTLYDAAGVTRATGARYDTLLELLMLCEPLAPWSSNQLSRLTRAPKRHLVEPALLGPLLGVEPRAVLRNADLLGRLIESFVLAQLRPERDTAAIAPNLFHLRQEHGRREIDLIAEAPDGRVLGIEIKASPAPDGASARHLCWLRDQLGEAFVAGVVFHTGPRAFQLDQRVLALPISTLWAPARPARSFSV